MLRNHLQLVLLFSIHAVVFAQRPEFGVRASLPVTRSILFTPANCPEVDSRNCWHESVARHLQFGLSVFVPLTSRLGLQTDPVYQRLGFGGNSVDSAYSSYEEATTSNRWVFPVLATWRVSKHLRPGLGAAVSFRSNATLTSKLSVYAPVAYTNVFAQEHGGRHTIAGVVAALEAPYRVGPITVAPDVRYTRWTGKHFGRRWPLNEVSMGLAVRF